MIEIPLVGKGVPFMIAGIVAAKVDSQRITEAVIIAVVSSCMMAVFGYFIALPVLQEQVGQVKREMAEMKQDIKGVRDTIDVRSNRRDGREALVEAKIVQLQIEMARMRK